MAPLVPLVRVVVGVCSGERCAKEEAEMRVPGAALLLVLFAVELRRAYLLSVLPWLGPAYAGCWHLVDDHRVVPERVVVLVAWSSDMCDPSHGGGVLYSCH